MKVPDDLVRSAFCKTLEEQPNRHADWLSVCDSNAWLVMLINPSGAESLASHLV